jgi:hypothetical protein
VAGRQRSKNRFKINATLEEGLAALENEDDAYSRVSHGMSTGDVNRRLGSVGNNANNGTNPITNLPVHQTNLSQNNVTMSTNKTPPAKSFTQLFKNMEIQSVSMPCNTVASRDADPTSLLLTSGLEQGTMAATVPSVVLQQNVIEINNLTATKGQNHSNEQTRESVINTGGNAITPAGRTARSYSHPQLYCISSHISTEQNPVAATVARRNVPVTATALTVQPSVVEFYGSFMEP